MASLTIRGLRKEIGGIEILKGIDLAVDAASSSCSSVRPAAASPRC